MGNSARPFQPFYGDNQSVNATATPATITLGARTTSVRLINTGAKTAFIRIGRGSQTASLADCPIIGGKEIILFKDEDQDTLSYIAPENTVLLIQTGIGGI